MKRITHLLGFIVILLPSMAMAQTVTSLLPSVLDTRSASMGRTAIVSVDGSNALFSNPAILAALPDRQIQGGGRLFMGINQFDVDGDDVNARYAPDPKLNHVSFSTPFRLPNTDLKLGLGLGYRTYHDFGYKYVETQDNGDREIEFTDDVSGGLNTLSIGVGVNYQDQYFAGISLNPSIRKTITNEFTFDSGIGDPLEDESEFTTSGSFFQLGGLARLTPALSVGVMYRPAFEWTIEVEEGRIRDLFPSFSGTDIDVEVPSIFGVGVSYQVSPGLLVAGEYQTRPISDFNIDGRDIFDIDDGSNIRVGIEFQKRNPVRLGLFRDTIVAADAGEDAPLSLIGITGGLGLNLGIIELDTGLDLARWSQELPNDGSYSENLVNLRATARYRFKSRETPSATSTSVSQNAPIVPAEAPAEAVSAGETDGPEKIDPTDGIVEDETSNTNASTIDGPGASTPLAPPTGIMIELNRKGRKYTYGGSPRQKVYTSSGLNLQPHFKEIIGRHPGALAEAKKTSTYNGIALVGNLTMVAGAALLLLTSLEEADAVSDGELSNVSYGEPLGLVVGGALVSLIGSSQARKHLRSAVSLFNNYQAQAALRSDRPRVKMALAPVLVNRPGLGVRIMLP